MPGPSSSDLFVPRSDAFRRPEDSDASLKTKGRGLDWVGFDEGVDRCPDLVSTHQTIIGQS